MQRARDRCAASRRRARASGALRRARRTTAARSAAASVRASTLSSTRTSDARAMRNHARASTPGRRSIASGARAVPVRRDLQDRRARKAAMREQQVLAKAAAVARHLGVDRNPGQIAVARERVRRERERHQRRPRRHDGETELLGDAVAERRRADLRHRQAAGGDDQRSRAYRALRRRDGEAHRRRERHRRPRHGMPPRRRRPRSHSVFSIAMICSADSSQKSWPSFFS